MPLSSLSLRFTFSLLSLCASTQPGILTIGVPTCEVTGGYTGNASGGSDVNHAGISGMKTSRILIVFNRMSGIDISPQSIFQ